MGRMNDMSITIQEAARDAVLDGVARDVENVYTGTMFESAYIEAYDTFTVLEAEHVNVLATENEGRSQVENEG